MIGIVKKKNKISRDLFSKIEWACSLNSIKLERQKVLEGCLRVIEHTNLAYVEQHRVIIKDNLYLFFNEYDYFYVGDLRTKYPLSKLQEYIARHYFRVFRIVFNIEYKTLKSANSYVFD